MSGIYPDLVSSRFEVARLQRSRVCITKYVGLSEEYGEHESSLSLGHMPISITIYELYLV